MIKKTAVYLSMLTLSLPLVSHAEALQWPSCAQHSADDRTQLQAFYLPLNHQPQWLAPQQQQALADQLTALADDALNPEHYPLPSTAPQGLDCHELDFSRQYLRALTHLYQGRLAQAELEPIWSNNPPEASSLNQQLLQLARQHLGDLNAAFAAARPSTAQYQALRQHYAKHRQQPLAEWPSVAAGALLRPNSHDARVPQLRARLSASGHLAAEPSSIPEHYDLPLLQAVERFQSEHGLSPDGLIGPATLRALNIHPRQQREQLQVALERLRWLRHWLEPNGLLINVAAAELHLYQDGQPVWQTRTQVGRPERPTPLLKSRLSRLTLNPSWTIPPTILKKDKLPKIRADLAYLEQEGLQVLDFQGQVLDPHTIDWQRPGGIMLRQPPGPKNPLGHLALRFANPFSVYLHDTPSQNLFSKSPRTFSSGCVRIEAVDRLAEHLLSEAELARVQTLIAAGDTYEYRLNGHIPLLMAYWTVEIDAQQHVIWYPDSYGHDAKILRALKAVRAVN
ncbi:L,D-transpeptidase family protein [Atopomonas sediminilitoris]|uniref:L,D-transpeptidase family protein n=1 Tax=Atopomonas sediminilitoris TaxID=2919919 RepID=UPI0035202D8F